MRAFIVTVGTSLLTNRDERPWAGWTSGKRLPEPTTVDAWLAKADPRRACAEVHTLAHLGVEENDGLHFFCSDTPEGRFCGEALGRFYRPRCRDVRLEIVFHLGYSPHTYGRALRGLVDLTVKAVREARQTCREPVFCATGGFKAEIAFLNLLGALLGVEVVYIHELHREAVRLPRLPLAWDTDFVLRHREFFDWIDAEPRLSTEVEERLKAAPELRFLVEIDEDGHAYLTAAGDLLYRAALERSEERPRALWPRADAKPPEEKNGLSGLAHDRPSGWETFVRWLCSIDCVSWVRFDATASEGKPVRLLDSQTGTFLVRYKRNDKILPLRVETTARGEDQCELVADYLRSGPVKEIKARE